MKRRRSKQPEFDPVLTEIFAHANAMTANGQEPRKHHVVPRFYLQRWAEDGRVRVTDLDAHKSHEVDPKKALIEKDFYRVPAGSTVGSDSPVVWEAWLSKLEGMWAATFAKFDEVGFAGLSPGDIGMLAEFAAVQFTRSRFHRYQARWMYSVGVYNALELHREGAIEAQMRREGQDPTPAEVADAEAYWARVVEDPWQMNLSAVWELDMAQRSAMGLADVLATRKAMIYETAKPLLTSDEPVVSLFEHLGADHIQDGGFYGTPIIVLPLDPHHVLAMFRSNMPVQRPMEMPLDWQDTLDLNRSIAGNAFRNVVSRPSSLVGEKLFIPASKAPTQAITARSADGKEIIRWRAIRRWSDEADAPERPVPSWWPPVVPLAPPPPSTTEERDAEYREWQSRGPTWD